MAKYYGMIGYEEISELRPGVYLPQIVQFPYTGDLIRNVGQSQQSSESENDDLRLSNEISIVADAYAYDNFGKIKFAEFLGQKWRVTRVEVRHPRLILSLGGLYNDPSFDIDQPSPDLEVDV